MADLVQSNVTKSAVRELANSVADARGAEMEIRKKLIQGGAVDVLISISPDFFYTVTLPCMLWFFDRAKPKTSRKDSVLFIDARNTFRQLDRAHRDFEPSQIEFIGNIVRLYRGTAPESVCGSAPLMQEQFADGSYHVPGSASSHLLPISRRRAGA